MYLLSNLPDPDKVDQADERGEDFYPFFNNKIQNHYDELPLTYKNTEISNNLDNKSQWFLNKKYYPKSENLYNPLFSVNFIPEEQEKVRTRRIKLILPQQTKIIVTEWSNLYRFAYNKAVGIFKDTGLTGRSLRDCIKSDVQWGIYPFVLRLPSELREGAANSVNAAIKTAFTNLKNGNIKHFDIKFKSKRYRKWTLNGFQHRSYKKTGNKEFTLLKTYCLGEGPRAELPPRLVKYFF